MSSFEMPWAPVLRYVREGRLDVALETLSESEAMARPAFRRITEPLLIWQALPRVGDLPHRRELRAERFAGYLPKLCIVELMLEKEDFRWALHGGEHEYWLGYSLKGRHASEFDDEVTRKLRTLTLSIYRSAAPGFFVLEYRRAEEVCLRANTLCLPFAVDEPNAGALLCPTEFEALCAIN